jgi:hypothetical protein
MQGLEALVIACAGHPVRNRSGVHAHCETCALLWDAASDACLITPVVGRVRCQGFDALVCDRWIQVSHGCNVTGSARQECDPPVSGVTAGKPDSPSLMRSAA